MQKLFLTTLALYGVSAAGGTPSTPPTRTVLSLQAAGDKGYITAKFVDYLEQRAYALALQCRNVNMRPSQKIAMSELFDTIAGSETGAIIGSTLLAG